MLRLGPFYAHPLQSNPDGLAGDPLLDQALLGVIHLRLGYRQVSLRPDQLFLRIFDRRLRLRQSEHLVEDCKLFRLFPASTRVC